jgi:hypothetical protein
VYFTDYSSITAIQTTPFTITVEDPCGDESTNTITPSNLFLKKHTVGMSVSYYDIPPFYQAASWCPVTYSYSANLPAGTESAVTFAPDTRTFTFLTNDVSLAG